MQSFFLLVFFYMLNYSEIMIICIMNMFKLDNAQFVPIFIWLLRWRFVGGRRGEAGPHRDKRGGGIRLPL